MGLKKVAKNNEKINPMQELKKHRALSDKLEEEFKEEGVRAFSPDKELNINSDYLSLPSEITEVSSRDLGEYLNAYTQQKMYIRTLIGWTELLYEEARREYLAVSDIIYNELTEYTKLSETAKERKINSDPQVLPKYHNMMDLKKKLQFLNMNIESIEDAIFLISREVSRRTGDFKDENRSHNVSRK